MITKIHYLLMILSISSLLKVMCSQANLTYPVAQSSVQPYSCNQDYITDYEINVYLPSSIAANASIQVEFPDVYRLHRECKAYVKINHNPSRISRCFFHSDHKYILKMDTIISGQYQIVFEGIHNPSIDTLRSQFKIETFINQTLFIDSIEIMNKVFFFPPPGTVIFHLSP